MGLSLGIECMVIAASDHGVERHVVAEAVQLGRVVGPADAGSGLQDLVIDQPLLLNDALVVLYLLLLPLHNVL